MVLLSLAMACGLAAATLAEARVRDQPGIRKPSQESVDILDEHNVMPICVGVAGHQLPVVGDPTALDQARRCRSDGFKQMFPACDRSRQSGKNVSGH